MCAARISTASSGCAGQSASALSDDRVPLSATDGYWTKAELVGTRRGGAAVGAGTETGTDGVRSAVAGSRAGDSLAMCDSSTTATAESEPAPVETEVLTDSRLESASLSGTIEMTEPTGSGVSTAGETTDISGGDWILEDGSG